MRAPALAASLLAGLAVSACASERPSSVARAPAAPASPPARSLPAIVPGRGDVVALVRRASLLRAAPGGRALKRAPAKTQFGSPRVFAVVARRGSWVGVIAPELRNGQVGWLDARRVTRLFRVPYTLEAHLSARRLVVRRLGRPVATAGIAIGRPSAQTPLGRFAVTDKIRTGTPDGPYGCCILALSGHQPRQLQGWGGGDRLALHATPSPETIGQAVSHGCLRATNPVMRRLVREIPLGTPLRVMR